MGWSISTETYEARVSALELALEHLVPQGRLCVATSCVTRSEVAVLVEVDGRRGWVGLCPGHLLMFIQEHADNVRAAARRLQPDDVLDQAPLTPDTGRPPGVAADDLVLPTSGPAVPTWGRRSRR